MTAKTFWVVGGTKVFVIRGTTLRFAEEDR
jgi:hypothetical protein